MFNTRLGRSIARLGGGACACWVLMLFDGCDPAVRDVWLNGIETAATGVVTALTSLLTTAVTALITGAAQNGSGTVTTVQAVFEWAQKIVC